jgi:5-(carboxyamino)imidazole ribonucleotide mutase
VKNSIKHVARGNEMNGKISIIIGSKSDLEIAKKAEETLKDLNANFETRILSCHRNYKDLETYIASSDADVFIAIAGLSAHLPGFVAARTKKPVIGVPVNKAIGGIDSLLSIVQMPKGVPVACVGIDNAENAAYFAHRIIELIKEPSK